MTHTCISYQHDRASSPLLSMVASSVVAEVNNSLGTSKTWNFIWPTSLTTQSTEWLLFYTTVVSLLVRCAFWGSYECAPSSLVFSFIFYWVVLMLKVYQGINFLYQHFPYLDATVFIKSLCYCNDIMGSNTRRYTEHEWSGTIYRNCISLAHWLELGLATTPLYIRTLVYSHPYRTVTCDQI